MSMSVGAVHVDVVPSTRDFVRDMRTKLLAEADSIGKEMGERIGRDLVDEIAKPVSDGIEKGVERARPEKGAAKTGKQAGSAFSRAFEREVRGALDSLPEVNLDVETDEARRRIGELRAELKDFFDDDGNLKLDVANEDGLAHIREIREELRTLRDENVELEVEFDIDRAIENLGKLERQARDHGQRAGDNFGKGLRSALDSAMRALPDIDVGINLDDNAGMAQLQTLFRQLEGLRDLEIGVDIREDQAVEGMRAILDQLELIAQDVEVSVRVRDDATASATALRAFLDRLFPEQETIDYFIEMETEPAQRAVGAFATQLQREIGGAIDALPDIDLDMDSSDAEFRIAAIRRELRDLASQRIGIDLTADEAFARMQEIRTRLEEVRELAGTRNSYNLDTSTAVAAMRSVADAMDEVEARGAGAHRVLNRFQEIALLVTLAFTPAAAAVLALAAAGLAVVAPIAAIAAGINGIKAAVGPLTDDLNAMRSAVSAAFVEGLLPAVGAVSLLMPTLTTGLAGVAGGLSAMATDMFTVAAEADNLAQLTTVFDQMNLSITGLGPSMGNLTDNIIEFADIGSSALITLGPLLDQVGIAWDHVLAAMQATGAGEAAVVALLQALTALLTLAAPLVQLGSSMFAVLGPALAAAINGTAVVVQALADAFDALPDSIQAVLATALLLRLALGLTGRSVMDMITAVGRFGGNAALNLSAPFRDGAAAVSLFRETLDDSGRSTAAWSQTVQTAGGRVSSTLDNVASRMRSSIPQAAEAAGRAVSEGLVRATDLAARAFDRLPDAAVSAASKTAAAVRGAPLAALTAMENGVNKAVDGFISGWARAEQATVNAGRAILNGWIAAENGLVSGAVAVGRAWDTAGNQLITAGSRIAAGWRVAEQGLVNGAKAVGSAWDGAGSAFVNGVAAIDRGINTAMMRFQELPSIVGTAARNTSTAIATGFRGMEERVRTLPDAFRTMGTSIGNALATIPSVISRAGQTIESGLLRVATVAEGAGRAIASGLSRAVLGPNGLIAALGGPWGIAIAAAVAGLALFGAAQADAAAKSASFKSEVQSTAEAIREAGGAITSHMREAELLNLVQAGLATSARTLGMDLSSLSTTAINGGAAWDQLRTKLEETARAGEIQKTLSQEMGAGLTEQGVATIKAGEAAQSLLNSLGPLADKYRQAADENRIFQEMIRESGNSMVGGIGNAAQLTAALSTLSDEMATTADRATALYTAMLLLTGGTLPVEIAVSNMRAALADTATAFEEARVAAADAGTSILNAAGQIDTTTVSGRALIDTFTAVGQSALTAATSAFDAAGGMQNVAAASQAAGDKVREQRDAFVAMATATLGSAEAANRYADQLGLIPDLVVTLLRAEGVEPARQEILQLQGLLQSVPPNTVVHVQVLSEQAFNLLRDLGVQINRLPDGSVDIIANDQTATAVQAILATIARTEGQVPVTVNGQAVPPAVDALRGDIAGGPPGQLPVVPDGTAVPGLVDGLRGDIAGGPPGQLPVVPDGTAVPPAVADLRAGVQSIPARLEIQPGDLAYIQTAIANIRRSIEIPSNFSIGVYDNASNLINTIRGKVEAPATMPIGATDVGAVGLINALRSNVGQVTTMPVTASDSGASGLINALRSSITATAVMPINAEDQLARNVLSALVSAVMNTTALAHINAEDTGARAVLDAVRAAIDTTTAIMEIDADPALAQGKLRDLIAEINRAKGTVIVDANTTAAQDKINALKKPTSSTHTVHIVTVGQLPRAMGGIVPANFSLFENGGLHNGRLTPMRANYARVVQPNTYRVIGDRARDAEAYIPINQAPRSQQILKVTAAQMGWGLHPITAMATGGVLATRREELIATQSTGSFQPAGASQVGGVVSARGVEQRLDAIAGLLAESPRQPTSITVEDRSGDPVQTARATQLALRLARH